MRMARFEHNGTTRWGFVDGDSADFAPEDAPTLVEALSLDRSDLEALRDAAETSVALRDVRLLAPVPEPPQFLGVGLNYAAHADESGMERPSSPQVFGLLASAIVGPDDPIEVPASTTELDWEVELAFVIGKPAHEVGVDRALEHVAGYTIVNDVSARDVQFGDGQWTRGKSFDTLKPMGPWITTTDELGAGSGLSISLWVNDVEKQASDTSDLIFGVAELVSFLSHDITLQTGAVVSTGTPSGVGFSRQPPEFLAPGDVVRLEIEGIGSLSNPVVAPS